LLNRFLVRFKQIVLISSTHETIKFVVFFLAVLNFSSFLFHVLDCIMLYDSISCYSWCRSVPGLTVSRIQFKSYILSFDSDLFSF